MNRLLPILVTVAVAAMAAFAWAAWRGEPLPTAFLFEDPPPLRFAPANPALPGGEAAALACPPQACPGLAVDVDSPVFALTPDRLYQVARGAVLAQDHVRILAEDATAGSLDLVQRTPILGVPEGVALRVVPWEGGASFFLVSQSRPGAWEPGTHAARIHAWVGAIERATR